jgi:glycosyltransferase involved in cell wall biosynthesis
MKRVPGPAKGDWQPTEVPLQIRLVQTGSHRSTNRYTEALAAAFRGRDQLVSPFTMAPGRLSGIPGLGRVDDYARRWLRQPIAVRRLNADVLHLVDDNGPLARWLPPERTVITRHDMIPLLAYTGAIPYDGPRWYLWRFRATVADLRRVAAVVCPSEATRRDVIRLGDVDESRVHVIHHGVDARFCPLGPERVARLRESIGVRSGHLILHVGTGIFYKNVSATLEALHALQGSGSATTIAIVGAGLGRRERELCGRLGLDGAVRELGAVDDERLVELYNAADVLLFPSFAEGFGWPVLEAMACGTPVVAADIPALREVGGEAVMYGSPRDPRELADAVRAIIGSPERAAALGEAGRARAAQFTWDRAIDGYQELYRDVAAAAASVASPVSTLARGHGGSSAGDR